MKDILAYNLKLVVCGTAISDETHIAGHYYASSNNQFWDTLAKIGLTLYRLQPKEDQTLPNYLVGLTDIIKDQHGNDTTIQFNTFNRDAFEKKIIKYKPKILCFNGKKAAELYFKRRKVEYGLCAEKIGDTLIFIAPSTSGSARKYWDIKYWNEVAALAK
jgi:TDG/mug DNA glycosylase family protein